MTQNKTDWFFNSITALQGDMFAYAFSITKSREDAEDAVHNAIIKAFDGLPELKSRAKLRPWLFRILRNECLKLINLKSRFTSITDDMPAEHNDLEERLDLGLAINSLGDEFREVVLLYYKLGYSTGEIAKIVGIPRGTVMSRLARARELIRIRIEGE